MHSFGAGREPGLRETKSYGASRIEREFLHSFHIGRIRKISSALQSKSGLGT